MLPCSQALSRLALYVFCCLPLPLAAADLNIANDIQSYNRLEDATVTLSGKAELHIDDAENPIPNCVINLTSPDAWFFMDSIQPSAVASSYLQQVQVNNAPAELDKNCRVVQFGNGTVVIPQGPEFPAMTVYEGAVFNGASQALQSYTKYNGKELGRFNDKISSFRLKRGYMATIAENPDGSGSSKNYIAADGDLEISVLPEDLENKVSFVRIFPWRWVTKKGACDVDPNTLNAGWFYNWNINANSSLDREYVAIKQQRWWPGLDQDWKARGVNHLSGYNEPNNHVEDAYKSLDNGSTDTAVRAWPELLSTGLRVGAPAVTDGGYGWLVDFMNKARDAGHRIDYVPVHYYRSFWKKDDPAGAANQLYRFLKSIHDATGRPVWVTEFNNGANWTDNNHDPNVEQNRKAVQAMIQMMDKTPWIERYSIYSRVEWFRQTQYDDGKLTPMGQMYRDHISPMAYRQIVPDANRGPDARFSFNGDFQNLLGNGNDIMAVGVPKFADGISGLAVSLDGSHDYLQLSSSIGDSENFTFTGWVKWNGGPQWQRIFDFGWDDDHTPTRGRYMFLTPDSGNGIKFAITSKGHDNEQKLSYPQPLPTDQWIHLAVTINGDVGKLFINGNLVDTNRDMKVNPIDIRTAYNYLGKSQFAIDPLFNGQLDNVEILSKALTDREIKARAIHTHHQEIK